MRKINKKTSIFVIAVISAVVVIAICINKYKSSKFIENMDLNIEGKRISKTEKNQTEDDKNGKYMNNYAKNSEVNNISNNELEEIIKKVLEDTKSNQLVNSNSTNLQKKKNTNEKNLDNKTAPNSTISQKVNINTATQTELETLPGIGPSTALKILNYRQKNGKFKTIQDIKNVSGIGDKKYAKIEEYICI